MKAIRLRARRGPESLGLQGRTDTLSGAGRGAGRGLSPRGQAPGLSYSLMLRSQRLRVELDKFGIGRLQSRYIDL